MNDFKPEYAIWFAKFRQFKTEELGASGVVFLNFLMFRARGKNYREFELTDNIIEYECGIKRTKLSSLTKKFQELGFLSVRTKGIKNPKHYHVNFKTLATEEVLEQLVRPDAVADMLGFTKQEAKLQSAALSNIKATRSKERLAYGVSKWDLQRLIEGINDTFASRIKIYNENEEKRHREGRHAKSVTQFHPSKAERLLLSKLLSSVGKDFNAILQSSVVFFDQVLWGKRAVNSNMLAYFATEGEQGDFPVFRECLDQFKLTYGYDG